MTLTRDELIQVADEYLEALATRDPRGLNVSPVVRFTENCQVLPLGQGLWGTATGAGTYRFHFADVAAQQVGVYAVVEEMGQPAILALRLGFDAEQIREVEHIVGRRGHAYFQPENLVTPDPVFQEILEPARRSDRATLIKASDLYYDAIQRGDGSIVPVMDECLRIENGVQTCLNPDRDFEHDRLTVAEGIDAGYWLYLYIRDRRFPIVDEERGVVWSINFFETAGNVASIPIKGKGDVAMPPESLQPGCLPVAELFRVVDGRISRIETVLGPWIPFGSRWNWDGI